MVFEFILQLLGRIRSPVRIVEFDYDKTKKTSVAKLQLSTIIFKKGFVRNIYIKISDYVEDCSCPLGYLISVPTP